MRCGGLAGTEGAYAAQLARDTSFKHAWMPHRRTVADGCEFQVEPQEKKKTPKGRAKKRITYTRRFVNVTLTGGKRKVSIQICSQVRKAVADKPNR
jgi:small subunit ribosomal protein S30e